MMIAINHDSVRRNTDKEKESQGVLRNSLNASGRERDSRAVSVDLDASGYFNKEDLEEPPDVSVLPGHHSSSLGNSRMLQGA
jgi:hypothetical protein